MVVVPDDTPVTVPVVLPTDAIATLLLCQVPPDVPSLSVNVAPGQMALPPPVIALGTLLNVIAVVYTMTGLQPFPVLLTVKE